MKRDYGNRVILDWLLQNNHTMMWLSEQTNIPYSTLKRKLYRLTEFREGELNRLISVTGMTYEQMFLEEKESTA